MSIGACFLISTFVQSFADFKYLQTLLDEYAVSTYSAIEQQTNTLKKHTTLKINKDANYNSRYDAKYNQLSADYLFTDEVNKQIQQDTDDKMKLLTNELHKKIAEATTERDRWGKFPSSEPYKRSNFVVLISQKQLDPIPQAHARLHIEHKIKYEKMHDYLGHLEKCIVMETTPRGNVVMLYSPEKRSFIYYADVYIPHAFLETAAKKYAVQFNCKYIMANNGLVTHTENKYIKLGKMNAFNWLVPIPKLANSSKKRMSFADYMREGRRPPCPSNVSS